MIPIKTLYFSETYEDRADIEWVLKSDLTTVASIDDAMNTAITKGAIIGYSLDSSGDIDTVDVTSKLFEGTTSDNSITIQSSKVLKAGGESYSIDSNAVVFTYDGESSKGMLDSGSYDVSSLDDLETGEVAGDASIILNEDGDVVAIFLDDYYTSGDDYIYGVINKKTSSKDDGRRCSIQIYRIYRRIVGSATKLMMNTARRLEPLTFTRIKLDSSDIITEIESMNLGDEYKYDKSSGCDQQQR